MSVKQKKRKKLAKIIISLSLAAALAITLIVLNVFIPLKYLPAYIHFDRDKNAAENLRITFVDVGYGDCTLIEFPNGKTMLIDGGVGTYNNSFKLINLLNSRAIGGIDYLVCTSVKSEHCGGLSEILRRKKVKTAYIPYVENAYITDEYAEFYKELLKSGASVKIAEYGEGEEINSNCRFGFLSPTPRSSSLSEYHALNIEPIEPNINAASAVLWIDCFGRGFMFASDATSSVLDKVADWIGLEGSLNSGGQDFNLSPCEIIKVANHGKYDNISSKLFNLLSPAAAVVPFAAGSQIGLNALSASALYGFVGENVFRTDIHGTITATASGENVKIVKEKK